jgi:hypothetical protein
MPARSARLAFRDSCLGQYLKAWIIVCVCSDFFRDALQHSQHFGILLFGQQIDLQVQLITAFAEPRFMVLASALERLALAAYSNCRIVCIALGYVFDGAGRVIVRRSTIGLGFHFCGHKTNDPYESKKNSPDLVQCGQCWSRRKR